jgi:hypothetical protein
VIVVGLPPPRAVAKLAGLASRERLSGTIAGKARLSGTAALAQQLHGRFVGPRISSSPAS